MRLIHARTFVLEEFFGSAVPPYAILSHTWGSEEVSIRDMQDLPSAQRKAGFVKIKYSCEQARRDRLQYVWVDTCCIDKSSSAELQEAINSMFSWYANAVICYAYLSDIFGSCPRIDYFIFDEIPLLDGEERGFWKQRFAHSVWFTRGWTLQELIAPKAMRFYGRDWNLIGDKVYFEYLLADITKVDIAILKHTANISSVNVAKRMMWAANRKTSREEDQAYSLLGIFGVNMPMLYGEGIGAFKRLQEEIIKTSNDHSIFAWSGPPNGTMLTNRPGDFKDAENIEIWGRPHRFETTNRGLRISLRVLGPRLHDSPDHLAVLDCQYDTDRGNLIAVRIRKDPSSNEYYALTADESTMALNGDRRSCSRMETVHLFDVKVAQKLTLEIMNEFEQRRPYVTFLLYLHEGSSEATIKEITLGPFHTQRPTKLRQAAVRKIQRDSDNFAASFICPTSAEFWLAFGYDTVKDISSSGSIRRRILPGLLAQFYRASSRLLLLNTDKLDQFGCDPGRIRNGGCRHGIDCQKPIENGCPNMQTVVGAMSDSLSESFTAQIECEDILGELVFTIVVRINTQGPKPPSEERLRPSLLRMLTSRSHA